MTDRTALDDLTKIAEEIRNTAQSYVGNFGLGNYCAIKRELLGRMCDALNRISAETPTPVSSNLVTRLRDLSNRLRDSGRYTADECDLAAASLIDEAVAALPAETACKPETCERLRDCEISLGTFDPGASSEYWLKYGSNAEKAT